MQKITASGFVTLIRSIVALLLLVPRIIEKNTGFVETYNRVVLPAFRVYFIFTWPTITSFVLRGDFIIIFFFT